MYHDVNAVFYSDTYHPIQAGSIDGTDTLPHDNAVYRALLATSTGLYDPTGDAKAEGNAYCKIFVGRLSKETTEATLQEVMSSYGRIKSLRLVRDIVTGASQGYAFVEYDTEKEMRHAYEAAHLIKIDGQQVLVDYNRQLLMPGWIPRRLGGGLGGRKESGQLRFGGRDRPFRKPLRPIPEQELQKLGIPLPGNYMQRYETPPLPKRRSSSHSQRHEEEDNKWHSERVERKRAYKGEEQPERDHMRHSDRDDKRHSDGDDKWQHYHKKDDIRGEGTRHFREDKDERYDRRRKPEERHDVNHEHEDDRRRPDERSKHEERHGHRDDRKYKRREYDRHERLERDEHYNRGSGRAHGHHRHGGDEKMEFRGHRYEDERKRKHLAEASDDGSLEIDDSKKRKLRRRERDERSSDSREPSIEDRWKP